MSDRFHDKPFDEGTKTKLRLFELYTREWLPVFLSSPQPRYRQLHIFDFFAGPGRDAEGVPGSPLRILDQLREYQSQPGWNAVTKAVHFYDKGNAAIKNLHENVGTFPRPKDVAYDIKRLPFQEAFTQAVSILQDPRAAKLVFIDQFGVDQVTSEVFRTLVKAPACDFLFFISSSTLHRFRDHPAIKQKFERPDDYFHVHRAVLKYYKELIPESLEYYLAPFSIKKDANIYGVIFGSAHPLGIDKFLHIAWKTDEIHGEADFDIGRSNLRREQLSFPMAEMRPSKLTVFEQELETRLRAGEIRNEKDVLKICFDHGVKRQHARPVLQRLKNERVIDLDFLVPDIRRLREPRPVKMTS